MRRRFSDFSERALDRPVLGPILRFVTDLATAFRVDRVTGLGAEIAFFAFLSLFPLLLVFASALGLLDRIVGENVAARAENAVIEFLERTLTDEGSGLIDAVRDLFAEPAPGLLSIGIVLTLWTASRGFAAVTNALDVVYDFEERRSWLQSRAIGLAMTVGTVVVVVIALGMLLVGPLLGTAHELADNLDRGDAFVTLWIWFRGPFVFLVLVLWAATVYHVAPSARSPWRFDLPGALLAAVGWLAVTVGFSVYVRTAGMDSAAGTVGSVVVAVLWMYAMSIVLLAGGEVNALIQDRRGIILDPAHLPDDEPVGAAATGDSSGGEGATDRQPDRETDRESDSEPDSGRAAAGRSDLSDPARPVRADASPSSTPTAPDR